MYIYIYIYTYTYINDFTVNVGNSRQALMRARVRRGQAVRHRRPPRLRSLRRHGGVSHSERERERERDRDIERGEKERRERDGGKPLASVPHRPLKISLCFQDFTVNMGNSPACKSAAGTSRATPPSRSAPKCSASPRSAPGHKGP